MFLVNWVFNDEELLEPYEWQDDDTFQEFYYLPIYLIPSSSMHDFMYCQLKIDNIEDSCFIVSDLHYSLAIEIKDKEIYRRGTITGKQRDYVKQLLTGEGYTLFQYEILEEAYEKEFGLTREERMKKICLEEVIDEIFVMHYDLFLQLCDQFHIYEEGPSEKYLALKHKLEKGYSSIHELLYKELVQKE